MDKVLQELYHGMIHPEEEYQPAEEIRQERNRLDRQQQRLMEQLCKISSQICTEIEELFEAETAVDAMEMENAYIQGMRMGARLALALLGDQK
ncbi:MAG: hypothetical protein IKU38_01175 [Clostridia bacterium]|nr:hypothetical protein [Clostridia bacterium]